MAFALYCRLPFGRLHSKNPEIVAVAAAIGRTPSALAMKLTNIASLDPAIISTGRSGLSGASANDREMWNEMQGDWERFAVDTQRALFDLETPTLQSDYSVNGDDGALEGIDRAVTTTTRIGQGFFRRAVMSAYDGRCCITGLSVPSLLVASHIVPWAVNAGARVNPHNGILLSALHEKAFDAGLITINDDLTVRISAAKVVTDDQFYASSIERYDGQQIYLPKKFYPDPDFLAYHKRPHIFMVVHQEYSELRYIILGAFVAIPLFPSQRRVLY